MTGGHQSAKTGRLGTFKCSCLHPIIQSPLRQIILPAKLACHKSSRPSWIPYISIHTSGKRTSLCKRKLSFATVLILLNNKNIVDKLIIFYHILAYCNILQGFFFPFFSFPASKLISFVGSMTMRHNTQTLKMILPRL